MGFLSPGECLVAVLAIVVAGPLPVMDTGPPSLLDLVVDESDLQAPLLAAGKLGGVPAARAEAPSGVTLERALLDLYDAVDADLTPRQERRMVRTARGLDPELRAALAPLVAAVAYSYRAAAEEIRGVPLADVRAACDESDPLGPAHARLAAQLDASAYVSGGLHVLAAVEASLPLLRQATSPRAGPLALDPYGMVVVSGEGGVAHADSWTDALLFVDLGGDDSYGATGGASGCAGPGPIDFGYDQTRVFIDLDGDDSYATPHAAHPSQGSSEHGVGIHVDVQGNDTYRGQMFQQGYGEVAGVGVLVDLEGDDRYALSEFGQGSGAVLGIGILADGDGNDRYDGHNFTKAGRFALQGVGMLKGVGVLVDDGLGNDVYRTRELATQDCLCQGTSFQAGAGALIDRGGDDTYGTNHGRAVVLLGAWQSNDHGAAFFADLGGDDTYRGVVRGENDEPWGRGAGPFFVERGQDCEPPAVPCEVF